MRKQLLNSGSRLAHLAQMLDSLSPLGTLQRGYAIVTDGNGKVLRNTSDVSVGDAVEARLAQGLLGLVVQSVESD